MKSRQRLRLGLCLFAAFLVWVSALTPLAAAQGATVVTGKVTLDGNPIGAGTVIQVKRAEWKWFSTHPSSGGYWTWPVIAVGFTGTQGLDSNEYRIDIHSTSFASGQTINVSAVVDGETQWDSRSAVVTAGQVLVINVPIMSVPGSATPADALAAVVATGFLELVTSFNYATRLYESFVPNVPGDSLAFIRPNSVLIITTTEDLAIVVGTKPFTVSANTPTPVPIGGNVFITLA